MMEINQTFPTAEAKTNMAQRPTTLTVGTSATVVPSNIGPTHGITEHSKTSPAKQQQSPSAIIAMPPSPNKLPPTSPTSPEVLSTSATANQSNSQSFVEMVSSFFRWGGKGGANTSITQTESGTTGGNKVDATPKVSVSDMEGVVVEQQTQAAKSFSEKPSHGHTVTVGSNPTSEGIKVLHTTTPITAASAATGKHQRQSRKTMRAPQPPIASKLATTAELPETQVKKGQKAEAGRSSCEAGGTNEHSFHTDAAEVQQMEQKLLNLLSDFNSGKVVQNTGYGLRLFYVTRSNSVKNTSPLFFTF